MNQTPGPGKKPETLKNVFLNNYAVPRGGSWLVVTGDSCFKISASTKNIISRLPRKGPPADYLGELRRLGVPEPEKILAKLVEIKCLVPGSENPWHKTLLKYLLNPALEFFPSKLQDRVFFFLKDAEFTGEALFRFALASCLLGLLLSALFSFTGFSAGRGIALTAGEQGAVFAIILLSILVHEAGHSIFAYLNGIGFRPIGFSLYLMYPVFYANVSGIGELPLKPKISINLAGLALQSLFMAGVVIAYLATGWGAYFVVTQYLAFLLLFNLNPLLNTDGYWCYKDIVSAYKGNRYAVFSEKIYSVAMLGFTLYLVYVVWLMAKGLGAFLFAGSWSAGGVLGALINVYILVIVAKGLIPRFKDGYATLRKQ